MKIQMHPMLMTISFFLLAPGMSFSDTCSPLDGPIQTLHETAAFSRITGISHGKECSVQVIESADQGSYSYELRVEFAGKNVQTQLISNTCNINNTQASAYNEKPANTIVLLQYEELTGAWGGEQDQYINTFKIKRTAQGQIASVAQVEDFGFGSTCNISD